MNQEGNTAVPITQRTRISFDDSGSVSNHGEKTAEAVSVFKGATTETLGKNGIEIEWVSTLDNTCDASIRLVELDIGSTTIRSIMSWMSVLWVFGPPATFEIEGQWLKDGNNMQLHYKEGARKAIFGTDILVKQAASKTGLRFADDIRRFLTDRNGQ